MADAPSRPSPPSALQDDPLAARLQAALGDAYVVEGKLGSGGFAVVYLVRDVHLKRKLAAKVLLPDVITSRSVLERFRREAETVAQLSHPHIVPLHFIGQKDDLVYLVMEAIDGGSLADRLARETKLPIGEAARIFGEVASALAHAHKRGVVHRDIKPHNILLDADSGRALVTDFGIARTAESGSLTATGLVVGTAAYLSPEQVSGEPSDHRADIYALGVMTYEMLAGQPPFTGATPTSILMKRLAGPPEPLRNLRGEVPAALEELVDACLAANPNDRIQNAADIARALTGHSPVSGGHTTSTRRQVTKERVLSRSAKFAMAAVGVLVAGGATAAIMNWGESGSAAAVVARVNPGMVLIDSGTFTIGSDSAQPVARPAHRVRLPAFGIDQHEVTVGDFREFVDSGLAVSELRKQGAPPNVPITGVLWSEAVSYCQWRHKNGGRLPTEEEWEAAARGTSGRLFPWGNEWNATAANVDSADGQPVEVSRYPGGRTPEGIDDLIGNVWEWTSSPFRPYGDSTRSSASDAYVIRGGAFNSFPSFATAVFRAGAKAATGRENLAATGFRCAMTARAPSP